MNFYVYRAWGGKYTGLVAFDEDMPEPGSDQNTVSYDIIVRGLPPPPECLEKPIRVRPCRDGRKTIDNGDFVSTSPMIISQKVVDSMGSILEKSGILYPLEVHEFIGNYWLFHVTNIVDCLDEDHCDGYITRNYSHERKYTVLYQFAIDRSRLVPNMDIFCVPHYTTQCIFVSDNFLEKAKENGLTGLRLYPENINWMTTHGKEIIVNKKLARRK